MVGASRSREPSRGSNYLVVELAQFSGDVGTEEWLKARANLPQTSKSAGFAREYR